MWWVKPRVLWVWHGFLGDRFLSSPARFNFHYFNHNFLPFVVVGPSRCANVQFRAGVKKLDYPGWEPGTGERGLYIVERDRRLRRRRRRDAFSPLWLPWSPAERCGFRWKYRDTRMKRNKGVRGMKPSQSFWRENAISSRGRVGYIHFFVTVFSLWVSTHIDPQYVTRKTPTSIPFLPRSTAPFDSTIFSIFPNIFTR